MVGTGLRGAGMVQNDISPLRFCPTSLPKDGIILFSFWLAIDSWTEVLAN